MSIIPQAPKPTESKKKPAIPMVTVPETPVAASPPYRSWTPSTTERASSPLTKPPSHQRKGLSLAETAKAEEYLSTGMNTMGLGDPTIQSMGACRGVVRRPASSIRCQQWRICDRLIDSLQLPGDYFDVQYDRCYCKGCIVGFGDNLYFQRGVPPKLFGLPKGWCRFGLRVPARATAMHAFALWHVAYHGTVPQKILSILESENLLMPGDYTVDGKLLAPPSGHFTETRKPAGFDIQQIFVSPTIKYAGLPAYSQPHRWTDPQTKRTHTIQVAIQVLIKPEGYIIGKETVGLGRKTLDPRFDNSELEWSTKNRGATILTGILVKCE